ncbi:MAG: hypothetical protein ICV83_17405 [Cytophagales bacterium]|nr:hypothetical protein [Cytophagales bacterium]
MQLLLGEEIARGFLYCTLKLYERIFIQPLVDQGQVNEVSIDLKTGSNFGSLAIEGNAGRDIPFVFVGSHVPAKPEVEAE